MTCHPEVVKRAQDEIDRVVGTERLPTYEDRENLPYIECIVKEIFRFNPAVPIGKDLRSFDPATLIPIFNFLCRPLHNSFSSSCPHLYDMRC